MTTSRMSSRVPSASTKLDSSSGSNRIWLNMVCRNVMVTTPVLVIIGLRVNLQARSVDLTIYRPLGVNRQVNRVGRHTIITNQIRLENE